MALFGRIGRALGGLLAPNDPNAIRTPPFNPEGYGTTGGSYGPYTDDTLPSSAPDPSSPDWSLYGATGEMEPVGQSQLPSQSPSQSPNSNPYLDLLSRRPQMPSKPSIGKRLLAGAIGGISGYYRNTPDQMDPRMVQSTVNRIYWGDYPERMQDYQLQVQDMENLLKIQREQDRMGLDWARAKADQTRANASMIQAQSLEEDRPIRSYERLTSSIQKAGGEPLNQPIAPTSSPDLPMPIGGATQSEVIPKRYTRRDVDNPATGQMESYQIPPSDIAARRVEEAKQDARREQMPASVRIATITDLIKQKEQYPELASELDRQIEDLMNGGPRMSPSAIRASATIPRTAREIESREREGKSNRESREEIAEKRNQTTLSAASIRSNQPSRSDTRNQSLEQAAAELASRHSGASNMDLANLALSDPDIPSGISRTELAALFKRRESSITPPGGNKSNWRNKFSGGSSKSNSPATPAPSNKKSDPMGLR